ncbi:MAG: hypothetical protein NVS1B11_24570 [Terriglobales bacterium]
MIPALVAITANTAVLKSSWLWGITAESGGLLKLHIIYVGPILERLHIVPIWHIAHLPGAESLWFGLAFHYVTGLAMAFVYIYILEPFLPGGGLMKGSIFSLLPWFLNSFAVLPLLGQGILGRHRLTPSGMVYFFFANWVFGVLLGVLYERRRVANEEAIVSHH